MVYDAYRVPCESIPPLKKSIERVFRPSNNSDIEVFPAGVAQAALDPEKDKIGPEGGGIQS